MCLRMASDARAQYLTQNNISSYQDLKELVSTLAKNATKQNPFEIILLQTTRKKNNWKTEEILERAVVTLQTERIKGSNP